MKNKYTIIAVILISVLAIAFSVYAGDYIYVEKVENGNYGATPTLEVYQGGTGASSFTAGQCLVGNGTGAITSQACGGTADLSTAQLGQIGDVSTSTLAYGHVLIHDGTNWQDTATSSLGIAADMTALAHTNIYVGNGSNVAEATSSFVLLDNGNVGIGTNTPAQELSVNGDIYLTGHLYNGTVFDEQVLTDTIGTPTYTTLDDNLSIDSSAGKYSGMIMTAVDATHISIATGTGKIRNADSDVAPLFNFDIDANYNFEVSTNELNYIYVDYNGGSPIFASTSVESNINRNSQFPIGGVWADGVETPHVINDGVILNNFRTNEQRRMLETRRAEVASGLIIGETGERYLTYTAGIVYIIGERKVFSAVDTSGTDRFKAVYRDGSGGWTIVPDQQQVSNTQYDDGDGTLGTIGVAKYGVFWVYILDDGEIYVQYGQDSYNLAEAQNAGIPATAPELSALGILAGKIIVLRDATNFLSIESAFDTFFPPSTAVNHNDLGGLQGGTTDEYYHLTSALYTVVGNTSGTNSGDVTLAGTPNYLTLSGQEITMTVLDINDDTNLVDGIGLSFTGNTLNWSSTGLDWTGNVIGDAYITKTGDWTGTLDTYNGSDLLNANAGTTGQLAYYAGDGSIVSGTSSVKVLYYLGDPYLISEVETIINSRLSASGDIYTSGNLGTEDYLKFDTSGRGIIDQSSNEQLFFLWTQFAENYFTIQNAATGNNPTLTATGSDANVGLTIDTKGTGLINFYGDYTFPQSDGDANQVLATDGSGALGWTSVSTFGTLAELNALLSGETIASTTASNANFINDAGYLVSADIDTISEINTILTGETLASTTTYTAGDHITRTGTEFDLDSEISVGSFQFVVGSSTMSTTTAKDAFKTPVAITITNVYGWCNSGTTTIQLDERTAVKTAGTDILSSALAIGDEATTASFSNASIAAGAFVNLDIDGYFVGSPTQCNVNIKYTIDD